MGGFALAGRSGVPALAARPRGSWCVERGDRNVVSPGLWLYITDLRSISDVKFFLSHVLNFPDYDANLYRLQKYLLKTN